MEREIRELWERIERIERGEGYIFRIGPNQHPVTVSPVRSI
jgi:hypothetical protein